MEQEPYEFRSRSQRRRNQRVTGLSRKTLNDVRSIPRVRLPRFTKFYFIVYARNRDAARLVSSKPMYEQLRSRGRMHG